MKNLVGSSVVNMSVTIYVLTNTVNNKQYVGLTKGTIQNRFKCHVQDSRAGSECAIHRAIRKYGKEAFLLEAVDTAPTLAELKLKEIEWIARLGTFGNGYNMTRGGDGCNGHKRSEETKGKLRKAQLLRFENVEERLKAAEYGRLAVITEHTKAIWRTQRIGNHFAKGMTYTHTVDARAAIGNAHRGKVVSEATKAKFRVSRIGKGKGERNAMASEENRRKVGASKVGRKLMTKPDGTRYFGYPQILNTAESFI